jgi:Carboxypeptidase regulatory-like domain
MVLQIFTLFTLCLWCAEARCEPRITTSPSEATAPGSISGRVFCSDSKTPCRFAVVTVENVKAVTSAILRGSNGGSGRSAQTDLAGNFSLTGLPAGEYFIVAREPGYLASYDRIVSENIDSPPALVQKLESLSDRVTVDAGQSMNVTLSLDRGASLQGLVAYDDGGVAISLPVHLFRAGNSGTFKPYSIGFVDPDLAPLGVGLHTEAQGRLYISGLPAGRYVVEVDFPDAVLVPSAIGENGPLSAQTANCDLKLYSGNTFHLGTAIPITLTEGEQGSADFTIPISSLYEVSGIVEPEGEAGRRISALVLTDTEDHSIHRHAAVGVDGKFAFYCVPKGRYELFRETDPTGNARGNTVVVEGNTIDLEVTW